MRARAFAIAASIGVHAILLFIFIVSVRPWPSPSERPVLDVQLTPLPHARAQPRRERRRSETSPKPGPEPVAPSTPPTVSSATGPATVEAPQPFGNGVSGGARQALRGLLGCEHAALLDLSAEERQRCEDRLTAARRASVPLPVNLDPRGLYVVNPVPYLNRKPRNGCKPMAGGREGPGGQPAVAVGIGCGKSF